MQNRKSELSIEHMIWVLATFSKFHCSIIGQVRHENYLSPKFYSTICSAQMSYMFLKDKINNIFWILVTFNLPNTVSIIGQVRLYKYMVPKIWFNHLLRSNVIRALWIRWGSLSCFVYYLSIKCMKCQSNKNGVHILRHQGI